MAVAQARGDKTASKLRSLLTENQAAKNFVTSFYDLADWARASGMKPMGLKIDSADLAELPLPAVAHLKRNHFVALMAADKERVVVIDRGVSQYEIRQQDFNELFSGYVLCFQ